MLSRYLVFVQRLREDVCHIKDLFFTESTSDDLHRHGSLVIRIRIIFCQHKPVTQYIFPRPFYRDRSQVDTSYPSYPHPYPRT
jgi:hypothetical protein